MARRRMCVRGEAVSSTARRMRRARRVKRPTRVGWTHEGVVLHLSDVTGTATCGVRCDFSSDVWPGEGVPLCPECTRRANVTVFRFVDTDGDIMATLIPPEGAEYTLCNSPGGES